MSLMAAFRCWYDNQPGVVIYADGQETVGHYRVDVKKIEPKVAVGEYDLVMGGSGYVGALIDGLARAVEAAVRRWPAGLDQEAVRIKLEQVLIAYHARQVTHYPDDPSVPEYKRLAFIVCLRDRTTSQIHLFTTDGTTAETKETIALVGWEEASYRYEVDWLYYPEMTMHQAVILGMHLFCATENSLYIGPPYKIVLVRADGMFEYRPEDVLALKTRVEEFDKAVARLVLGGPDLRLSQSEFQQLIDDYETKATNLRGYFIRQVGEDLEFRFLSGGQPNDPLPHFPDEIVNALLTEAVKRGRRVTAPPPGTNLRPLISTWLVNRAAIQPTPEQTETILQGLRALETSTNKQKKKSGKRQGTKKLKSRKPKLKDK